MLISEFLYWPVYSLMQPVVAFDEEKLLDSKECIYENNPYSKMF